MSTPHDRAHDDARTPAIEQERYEGKYAYELSHPTKYDHEKHKDDLEADDDSLAKAEHHIPESWVTK